MECERDFKRIPEINSENEEENAEEKSVLAARKISLKRWKLTRLLSGTGSGNTGSIRITCFNDRRIHVQRKAGDAVDSVVEER
jgi:hypothetical protein